jgi:tellurite resistance protein
MAAEAKSLCLLGLSQFDIAAFFGVSVEVLDGWKARHPELRRAIRDGTWQADAAVAASLFSHATVDAKVAFTWLKNRQPDLWRDKTEIAVASDVRSMTDEELDDEGSFPSTTSRSLMALLEAMRRRPKAPDDFLRDSYDPTSCGPDSRRRSRRPTP